MPYQVNMEMIRKTENPHCIFLHCLPACHDLNTKMGQEVFEKFGLKEMEVTDEVFRSKHSKVFDEVIQIVIIIEKIRIVSLKKF